MTQDARDDDERRADFDPVRGEGFAECWPVGLKSRDDSEDSGELDGPEAPGFGEVFDGHGALTCPPKGLTLPGMWGRILLVGALVSGCAGQTVAIPAGEWLERSEPDGTERLASVSVDAICGPSGRCESVTEWGQGFVVTDSGRYAWAMQRGGEVLRLCAEPCSMTLKAEETGALAEWSELTQSYAWAGWVRR